MKIPIHNVGSIGIISDLDPDLLPPEAWSNGNNIRFVDNSVHTVLGEAEIYTNATPPALITPHWILPGRNVDGILWAYPGRIGATVLNKVYATTGTTHTDITRTVGGDYTGDLDNLWNGCVLGGLGYLNNGVDKPQVWSPMATGQVLIDYPTVNWSIPSLSTPDGWRPRILRSWKGYLIALYTTEDGIEYPQRFRWSSLAEVGAYPLSWNHADPAVDAKFWDLQDTSGALVEAIPLRDNLFIYKEDKVYRAEFIGGVNVFKFRDAFDTFGAMAQRCVKNTKDGNSQIVMTKGDIIVHNGQTSESLLNDRMRRIYVGAYDPTDIDKNFLVPSYEENEYYAVLKPNEHVAGEPYLAFIINFKDGTVTQTDVPESAYHAGWDFVDPDATATSFDSQSTFFDQMVGTFGQRSSLPGRRRIVWCLPDAGSGNPGFALQDESFNHRDGTVVNSFVERLGLTVAGQDRQGNPKSDPSVMKHLTAIWPRVRVANGTSIYVSAAAQQRRDGPIEWQGPFEFQPGVDEKVEFDLEGALLGVKFANDTSTDPASRFFIDGYDLELEAIGETT